MPVQHAACGQDERAVADADERAALRRLSLDLGEQDGVVAMHHSRKHDVVAPFWEPIVELSDRGLGLQI